MSEQIVSDTADYIVTEGRLYFGPFTREEAEGFAEALRFAGCGGVPVDVHRLIPTTD